MLHHADGDDAVVAAGRVPVVLEQDAGAVGEADGPRALVAPADLLLGERDAGDVDPALAGEVAVQRPPAAAHVEHALAGPQQELGRDVPLLGALRLLDVLAPGREVGAGVLALAVEEELVEGAREVVVVGDVGLRAPERVELLHAAQQEADRGCHQPARGRHAGLDVRRAQVEEVPQIPFLQHEAAVDVGLGRRHLRVQEDVALELLVGEADRHAVERLGALEDVPVPVGVDDGELALADEAPEEAFDQHACPRGLRRAPSVLSSPHAVRPRPRAPVPADPNKRGT